MIVLYYPQNTPQRLGRLPMSLLALAAVLEGKYKYSLVDGNVDRHAFSTICNLLRSYPFANLVAVSVMPGTQMINAIAHCKKIKQEFPHVRIVWGGYFPSMHTDSVANSDCVDYVIRGQGEKAFLELVEAHERERSVQGIHNLSYRFSGKIHHTPEYPVFDPNDRPMFPYNRLTMNDYAIPTFVGQRTFCHETSVGCPHKCNFCGVVDVFNARWKAEVPERSLEIIRHLKERYGMDGIEFHDSDFFVSEKRVASLAQEFIDLDIRWWAEGRVDTLLKYDKETWRILERSGLRMIFFGAESGLDETLQLMDKGGVTVGKTKAIAALCRTHNVQSEFSFVMGANPTRTGDDIDATINLMYDLERINPKSQMHPFIYTPVPFGSIYDQAVDGGLQYPRNLDDWATHEWKQYTLRQNPHTAWLTRPLYNKIVNFRAVRQAYHPKMNDRAVARWRIFLLKALSAWRYKFKFFSGAYEVRILIRLLMPINSRYEGF